MPKIKRTPGQVKKSPFRSGSARWGTSPGGSPLRLRRRGPLPLGGLHRKPKGLFPRLLSLQTEGVDKKIGGLPLVVGLTGGIGSGKSTVAKQLRGLGMAVADADQIVHAALAPGGAGFDPVLKLFGPAIRGADGTLNRSALAERVFKNTGLRRKLERILHPIVEREFCRRIAAHRRGILVLDVPLLFEIGMDRLVDCTVVVWAPKKVCLSRLVSSGRMTRSQALLRMAAQMPLSEKRRRADFVLDNSGTIQALRRRVASLFSPRRDAHLAN